MCKWLFQFMLVVVFYLLFCKVLDGGAKGLSFSECTKMIAFVTILHILAFVGAWVASRPLKLPQRIAMVFVASQKSEGMSLTIITAIFNSDDVGLYMLPVVVYHTVQMILASLLTGYFRAMVERADCEDLQLIDPLADPECQVSPENLLPDEDPEPKF